jgi:uncharacterized protein YfiM (DUF2279 family)
MPKVWKTTFICFSIWAALLVFLSIVWYKAIFKGYFTFFDDSLEWLQMDKAGHFFCSFQVSRWFVQVLKWRGVEEAEAKRIGVWGGILYLSPIELLDGFALAYGFSWTDILANCAGSLALWLQYRFFGKIRYMFKFSFWPSPFAAMRKELLGTFLLSQIVKDYNGQIIWMSFSPNVLLKKNWLPRWLHLSIGYGVENMLGGHDNVWQADGQTVDFSDLTRYRQLYLSLDLNFQHLADEGRLNKWIKLFTSTLKSPFPALVFDTEEGVSVKWLAL